MYVSLYCCHKPLYLEAIMGDLRHSWGFDQTMSVVECSMNPAATCLPAVMLIFVRHIQRRSSGAGFHRHQGAGMACTVCAITGASRKGIKVDQRPPSQAIVGTAASPVQLPWG
jgi:hypothetical protein